MLEVWMCPIMTTVLAIYVQYFYSRPSLKTSFNTVCSLMSSINWQACPYDAVPITVWVILTTLTTALQWEHIMATDYWTISIEKWTNNSMSKPRPPSSSSPSQGGREKRKGKLKCFLPQHFHHQHFYQRFSVQQWCLKNSWTVLDGQS